ncbi:zinc ABC transporter substrate-binding protein [Patescibacteria group bacterium]|nr:zinc ABC transporter substrate-binding protein [Patescibacteria group bacterium]
MQNKIYRTIFPILLMAVLASACSPAAPAAADTNSQMNVTVSIIPEKYFVERIGGDLVNVNVMVGPGDSPHTYEPKADQMTALSQSAVYFSIGVEFESAWMERMAAANPEMQIVDISANLEKVPMTAHHHHEGEGEESEAEEEEGGLDPHVWTSPENAKMMSQTIFETLAAIDPAHQAEYQANLDGFVKDIDALEDEINANLSGLAANKFIVFHPAWGYFARDFGLEQIAIEIEGSEPSAQELAAIIDEAKEENVQVVFGQPEFSTKTAEYIAAEIGGQVILISPLAEDWLENLRAVSATFGEVLKSK